MKKTLSFVYISAIIFIYCNAFAVSVPSKYSVTKVNNEVDSITGFALSQAALPIVNAVISDGFSVVKTDDNGYYSLPRHERSEFIFISVPEAYEIPMGNDGAPRIYERINESGNFSHNFILKAFDDGGVTDFNHVMIGISDPQVRKDYETWRFRNETIKDINDLKASYPAGTKFYGIVVGDLVWDDYLRMEEHKVSVAGLGFPVFNVIGNHDHDMTKCGDIESDHYFKTSFGPTYYSFNRGNIHYVILDNIDYIGCNTKEYTHNITQNQIEWLIKDLAEVPNEKTIVLAVHAPMHGSNVVNRQTVYNLMGGRRNIQHIIAGHHHRLTNNEISTRLFEHVLGSANGAMWAGDDCTDGAPSGYGVFEAGDKGYNNWYYKATGKNADYQFEVYPTMSFESSNSKGEYIIANVWNYDSRWSVNIYENGVKKVMQQFSGIDPRIYDFLANDSDTRPNYPGSDGGTSVSHNPGYSSTPHLFSYKPTDPDADFVVEVTDRFGKIYTKRVLRNMMVASFEPETNEFIYRQDFNSLPNYPNHLLTDKTAKGTFVPGHSPIGWYVTTSGSIRPTTTITPNWSTFNYYRINNGTQNEGWIYSYGDGNPSIPNAHSKERALGSLISSNHRNIHFGVLIENNTGEFLNGLDIDYYGEMWRVGTNPATQQELKFAYALNPNPKAIREHTSWISQIECINIDSLSFVSPVNNTGTQLGLTDAAIDGNNPANRSRIRGKIDVQIAPGQVVLLRWEDVDDSGNDHGLAIDNLIIKALTKEPNSTNEINENQNLFYSIGKKLYFTDNQNKKTITIHDISGKIVLQQTINTNMLNLTNKLGNGIFIVRIGNVAKKLVF